MSSFLSIFATLLLMSLYSLSALSEEVACDSKTSRREVQRSEIVGVTGSGQDKMSAIQDAIQEGILAAIYETYTCKSCYLGRTPQCDQFVKIRRVRHGSERRKNWVRVETESAAFKGVCAETEDGDRKKTGIWKCLGKVEFVTLEGAPSPSAEVGCSCQEVDIEPQASSDASRTDNTAYSCNADDFPLNTLPHVQTEERADVRASGDIGDFADANPVSLKCGEKTDWLSVTFDQTQERSNGGGSLWDAQNNLLYFAMRGATSSERAQPCDMEDCPSKSFGCGYLYPRFDLGGLEFVGSCSYDPSDKEMPYTCKGRATLPEGSTAPTVQFECFKCR